MKSDDGKGSEDGGPGIPPRRADSRYGVKRLQADRSAPQDLGKEVAARQQVDDPLPFRLRVVISIFRLHGGQREVANAFRS